MLGWWRHLSVAGAVAGLLVAPHLDPPAGWLPCTLLASAAIAVLGRRILEGGAPPRAAALPWLACLAGLGTLAGLGAGDARLQAIDSGALRGPEDVAIEVVGHVSEVAKRSRGEVRFPLDTEAGRVAVVALEPLGSLGVGQRLRVSGHLAKPDEWQAERLLSGGVALELRAETIDPVGGGRTGLTGLLDRIRGRAEAALGEGMNEPQAALARGFVLGQDDLIDPGTRTEFERAGLAHLLAVSGQNVMLLAILAGVLLGLCATPLRTRLLLTIALIVVYVPVAGAGPSIQRAGVMGVAAIVATIAGRPRDRVYLPLIAALATLLINPRFGTDVGWQLSFAAVIGIAIWTTPLRALIDQRLQRRLPEPLARPLAEGAALTTAAGLATAPLMAHYFGQLSVATLPANLLVLVLVGPVMWLGMLIGILGQLPGLPLSIFGRIEGVLVDLIAAVARAFSEPEWAVVGVEPGGAATVVIAYLLLALLAFSGLASGARRGGLRLPPRLRAALATVLLVALAGSLLGGGSLPGPADGSLRVTALDVGQGDAILLQPPRGDPVLIDGGPPGGAAVEGLRAAGVERLRLAFVTHDQSDHSGGIYEVLEQFPVAALVHGRPAPTLQHAARASGSRVLTAVAGDSFDLGSLTLDVLWPPGDALDGGDPNLDSLVIAARYRGYDALLTGDAEHEATHLDPGALDLLKVAHHGSEDAGLGALLERSLPPVALITVGAGNPYGHPTEETLAELAEHGVCALRTDLDGAATVELGVGGVRAWTERGSNLPARPGCDGLGA